ncbi:hypothetical protein JX265_010595 [Neoarthrinium moseri]|uniref:Uncharacterized protein n=1 Tax=Neoarthrinium moseri TaxID=1658444 RepID=A0A9P9WE62_9PEZI|nr:uncharacterized protein JN550_011130 [Neoarthrinium moseri]KAI1846218.1 hypothetical protein JX266_007743 [Neoarthrinium moseri]KAI1859118.1 hypothetical protein JX265_010595 [Neoarthrinium moseri]KAI1860975.1 hypothetical protein JN550_011130 [Neoarthrinium moseri]
MQPLYFLPALAAAAAAAAATQTLPSPAICEDTIDGSPPFSSNDTPCLLRCSDPVAAPTGTLLPGMVNVTNIPYCQLNCVRRDASPAQSALAPDCLGRCQARNQGTPENAGWCMYWCVAGYGDLVAATACVPSLEYGEPVTSYDGPRAITYRPFTQASEWRSWYETQTLMSRTGNFATNYGPSSTSISSSTSSGGRTTLTTSSSTSVMITQPPGTTDRVTPSGSLETSAAAGAAPTSSTTSDGAAIMANRDVERLVSFACLIALLAAIR